MDVGQNNETQFIGDICVVSETMQLADRLMNYVLCMFGDDDGIDHVSRYTRKIYFKDHTIIEFIGRSQMRHKVQGFRGRIISEREFRYMFEMNMGNRLHVLADG